VSVILPGGRSAALIERRLQELEEESGLGSYPQNLFDEGPHLVSTPAFAWCPGPVSTSSPLYSDTTDLLAVWSRLRARGWTLSYATQPVSPMLILWTLPQNHGCADQFGVDLREAMAGAPAKGAAPVPAKPSWSAAPYGGADG
jgi:hypothetical protein